MSIDIDWKTLTEGPDGQALAETIRDFVHERFQHVPLPRLIRSVTVHAFDFGTVAPKIVLKDICDPLLDFYENDDDGGGNERDDGDQPVEKVTEQVGGPERHVKTGNHTRHRSEADSLERSANPTLSRGAATPGILGGTSNLGYFHLPLSAGLSGAQTPLAAVVGAHYQGGIPSATSQHHHSESFSSISPPLTETSPSRPTSGDQSYFDQHRGSTVIDDSGVLKPHATSGEQDRSPEDLQVVFHVTYSGDVKLSLTADVFLDYPMPSFVGIPLKLNITGLTFNGAGILAYIEKRAHLCFLAPEDADTLIGSEGVLESPEEGADQQPGVGPKAHKVGALLEDIKIESEMGETESGRQVLKNVGKIEKFVLEQVQHMFEDEFVYPSFWTFLV